MSVLGGCEPLPKPTDSATATPGNRAMSVSVECSSAWCSMASAARWAEAVRVAAAPASSRRSNRMSAWRSPGWMSAVWGRVEPRPDPCAGGVHAERVADRPRVGRDPDEAEDRGPGKADREGAVHQRLPPRASRFVPAGARVVGVHQQVQVGNDHRPIFRTERTPAVSSTSRSSRSVSMPGRKPKSCGSTA